MAISKRLRYEILRRDNHTCRYCGASAPDALLELDHVTPTVLGGKDSADNLVTACTACNNGKGSSTPDTPLVADVAQDAVRWAAAMKRAAAQQRDDATALRRYADDLAELWRIEWAGLVIVDHEPDRNWYFVKDPDRTYPWVVKDVERDVALHLADTEDEALRWHDGYLGRTVPPLPDDWDASVETWRAAGIDTADQLDALNATRRADYVPWASRYRYFCGVIWKKLERRQAIARSLIEADQDEA